MASNAKLYGILDLATAFLALVFGAGWIVSGLGLRFAHEVTGPLSSGVLGLVVGLVFLVYALRYFKVIR